MLEHIAQQQPKVFEQMLGFLRTGSLPPVPERVTLTAPRFVVPDFPPPAAKSQ